MFTVKWIAENGSEMLYGASEVSYTPAAVRSEGALNSDETKACVAFTDEHGTHCSLDSGDIYVMNAAGSTVSRYTLKTKTFPHGIAPSQAA